MQVAFHKDLETETFQEGNNIQRGETAPLATTNFIIINNSFSVALLTGVFLARKLKINFAVRNCWLLEC